MSDPFEAQLRSELQSLRRGPVDTGRLLAAGRRRAHRRAVRGAVLSAAACIVAGVAVAAAVLPMSDDGAGTIAESPDPAEAPSQSPGDARRDGVVPEVAALPLAVRTEQSTRVERSEGTWVLTRLGPAAAPYTAGDCALGDPGGQYGIDYVCDAEYSEILLLGDDGRIRRAYPMPGLPPDWIHVSDRYVYAGAVGDGGLPDSGLVRIDRRTLDATVVVLPFESADPGTWLPTWRVATPAQAARAAGLVDVGTAAPRSELDAAALDLPAIDELIDEVAG